MFNKIAFLIVNGCKDIMNNSKIKTDKRKKRLMLDHWNSVIHRYMEITNNQEDLKKLLQFYPVCNQRLFDLMDAKEAYNFIYKEAERMIS